MCEGIQLPAIPATNRTPEYPPRAESTRSTATSCGLNIPVVYSRRHLYCPLTHSFLLLLFVPNNRSRRLWRFDNGLISLGLCWQPFAFGPNMVDNRVKNKRSMWVSIMNKTSSLLSHFANLNSPHIGLMLFCRQLEVAGFWTMKWGSYIMLWKHGYHGCLHTVKLWLSK